jgi:beta-lactamase class D
MKKYICNVIVAIVVMIIAFSSCERNNIEERKDWAAIYKKHGVDSACFELVEHSKERVYYYNKARGNTRMSPASTFKIMASLIALETSVAPDEDLIIKWDGVKRPQEQWNKDMNMREAFKVSCEPYYKELMKRVGTTEIKRWLDSTEYGNMQIGNNVETFWTDNSLQITPDEQCGFLKKLYFDDLPFSKRTMRIARSLMLQEETKDYRWYYKSGTAVSDTMQMAWLVGFVEDSTNHPYFLANNFSTKDTAINIKDLRMQITREIFQTKGLLRDK